MRAVVYSEPEKFSVTEIPDVPLKPGQVRVATEVVGVCGTDQHLHLGEFGAVFPLTPGHEIIGTVVEVTEGSSVAVGDRVAVDNTIHCMKCANCQRGDFNYCKNGIALGVHAAGGFAEHVVAQDYKCYPVGDLATDAAALAEPTACVVHGLDVLDLPPAANVLVIGAGPTSQILSQLIVRGGASQVTMAAPTAFKLEVAKSHGIHNTVQLDRRDFAASVPTLREIAPDGFDAVVEATGAISVLSNVIQLVRSSGTLLVYGMAGEQQKLEISPYEIFRREIQIRGSFAHAYGFARAIEYLRGGAVQAEGIITHRFGLADYGAALDALRSPDCLKAVLEPQK